MIEELTAMFRVCKHIKRDGDRCNSPAMKGMNFCFHHIGGKVASLVRAGATYDASAQLDFPYPADREAIQQSIHLVAHALREAKIDNATANTYTRIFRLAEQNFHRWEKAQKATGKTKMQPPSDASEAPGGPLKPAVGLSGEQTTPNIVQPTPIVIPTEASAAGVPSTRGVRVLGWEASEAEKPALPTPATKSVHPSEATPNNDVIPNEVRDLRVASDATISSSKDATADGDPLKSSGGPCKPAVGLHGVQTPPTPHRQKSPAQQRLEDIYYGRIPPPDDL